jgi:hypothetical protein
MKKPITNEVQALKQKLADTEVALKQERLKNQALTTAIELAEQQFNLPIRKKSAGPPVRFQTVSHLHLHHPLVSMQTLCGLFGKSRQAWYDDRGAGATETT